MFKTIEGAADCEIRSVIHFLNARDVLSSEIRHQICQVYGTGLQFPSTKANTWQDTENSPLQ